MASTSIPKTMKAVVIEKTGGPEVLEYRTDAAVPQPKEGEVLVKNDFIGVNYIDTYAPPQSLKHIFLANDHPATSVPGSTLPPSPKSLAVKLKAPSSLLGQTTKLT